MKGILFLLLILFCLKSFGQPVVGRSGPANTVRDSRWMGQYNMYVPVYADTVQANLTGNIGIDSCYAIIGCRNTNSLWFRQCSPKKWIELLGTTGSVTASNGLTKVINDIQLGGALVNDSTTVNVNNKFMYFSNGEVHFDSLHIRNGDVNEDWLIRNRNIGLGFPVAVFKPASTNGNRNFAFDIKPNGSPGNYSDNGITWMDVCDADVSAGAGAVGTARVGITTTAAQFGSRSFGGAPVKQVEIVVDTDKRITLSTANTATFNIGKITQSQSLSGDYVGYTLLNTNNSVAESNPLFFIGNDFGSSRFGYIRWNNGATPAATSNMRYADQLEIVSNVGATNGMVLGALGTHGRIVFVAGNGAINAERMRIDSAGNVGIGTSSPSQLLSVGANTFTVNSGGEVSAAAGLAYINNDGGTGLIGVSNGAGNLLELEGQSVTYTNNSFHLAVTAPVLSGSHKTQTYQNATGTIALTSPTGGGTGQTSYTTGDIIYASATNVLSKLPIGTSAQTLHVVGGIPAWIDTAASGGGGTPAGNYGNVQLNRNGAFATPASDSLSFSSGQLMVKGDLTITGLFYNPTAMLMGSAGTNSKIQESSAGHIDFINRNNSAWTDVKLNALETTGKVGIGAAAGTANLLVGDLAGTGSRAVLADASGNLSAPISDRSVKKNINGIQDGLSKIMRLKPVSFEYKDGWKNYGTGKQVGFIAQDVSTVLPNSVYVTPATGKMGYNETDLIPILTRGLQELYLKVTQQSHEIERLKKIVQKINK